MRKALLNKLVKNALQDLADRYGNDGCNDLMSDDPLLRGVSKAELKEVEKRWAKLFPGEAKELGNELLFNAQLVATLVKSL